MLEELAAELTVLEEKSLKRTLRTVTRIETSRLTIDGRSLINFSSNNYLGLARDTRVIAAARRAVDQWGAGATASRLISGNSRPHEDLERSLAVFSGKESALVFPTGYMANLGVITALVGAGDAILMDRLCHASLIDAVRLSGARLFVYRHTDPEDAELALKRATSYRRRLLVTESLFSMDGDFAPLAELLELCRRYEAISLVDDAHAIGIWDRRADPDVLVGTLSKALGSQGGFVAGSRELIDTLINRARSFIFTTGLAPACVAAAQASLELIQREKEPREHLKRLSARLREGLRTLRFDILKSQSQIVPVLLGQSQEALRCSEYLVRQGIFAPAIRPPTVHAGQCRIRFSVTAEHVDQDVDVLLASLKHYKERS